MSCLISFAWGSPSYVERETRKIQIENVFIHWKSNQRPLASQASSFDRSALRLPALSCY